MPDFAAYTARIVSYTEGRDPLVMQREAPAILEELVRGVSDDVLRRRPAPGKWSVGEIITHLAEDEIVSAWRYRQMIEYPGEPILSFDQDLWARLGNYADAGPHDSLLLFRLLRESNLRLFAQLTPDQWQSYGVHTERGRMTVQELALHAAGHDRNHIDQVRRILGK